MSKHPAKKQPRTGTKKATEGTKIAEDVATTCEPFGLICLNLGEKKQLARKIDRAIRRAVRKAFMGGYQFGHPVTHDRDGYTARFNLCRKYGVKL